MGATFPNGITSFVTHRNLYDDVDAADIAEAVVIRCGRLRR